MVSVTIFTLTLFMLNFVVWTTDPLKFLIIGFSMVSDFQVRLLAGNETTSILNMKILIRDNFDATTEWTMPSIVISVDRKPLITFINDLHNSSQEAKMNAFVNF